jgi:putative aminopeptidase FrvX
MIDRLRDLTLDLMRLPGLSGHEARVSRAIAARLRAAGIDSSHDRVGNLIATIPGTDPAAPSVMVFTHTDQLGLIVRKIEASGIIRFERVGGIPDRALPATAVLLCVGEGRDVVGVIANKAHHATSLDEKFQVVPYADLYIDIGAESAADARARGVDVGTPIVYAPQAFSLGEHRVAGTSVDDRAGCAVLVEVARALATLPARATVHCVFSVQEEFNLRGAMIAAQTLQPDLAVQIDLILATDLPDMAARGDVALGGGPAMSLYSFHGRGTLNGTLPHPGLVQLFDSAAARAGLHLQRSAHTGVLTDASYVQLVGRGVGCIDLGFPMRYSHSALEVCDVRDLAGLTELIVEGIRGVDGDFALGRDRYPV